MSVRLRRAAWISGTLRALAAVATVAAVLGALGYGAMETLGTGSEASSTASTLPGVAAEHALPDGTPAPSGHGPSDGPWSSSAAVMVVIPTGGGQPCNDAVKFVPNITQWAVPPGCYGAIYRPNPAKYPQRPGFGWCNWWVRVMHPSHPDITENKSYPSGNTPMLGAAIFFSGGVQGADSAGHWAQVVAIAPDHYWVLISEMNFAWRGAGWAKVDYRYIHVGPGVHFIYA